VTILDLSAAAYHLDAIGDQPTLSASIAKLIVAKSPLHAWSAHPRLNPDYKRDDDDRFDVGTVTHSILLEGNWDIVEVCEFDSWRTKDAKAQAEEARAAGKIPLLGKHYDEVAAMVHAVRMQLPTLDVVPDVFCDGKPEQAVVWEQDGVVCRCLIDWLHDDYSAIDDLKTTSRSADPDAWTKTMFGFGGDIQVAFHRAGVKAATGVEPEFRFLVAETTPPFAVSVVSLDPEALALANDRMNYAVKLWRECLETDSWPGYSSRVHYVSTPGYLEYAWLEKEAREAA
jgi:hypothetical protein